MGPGQGFFAGHVLQQEEAADHFLGFGEGTVDQLGAALTALQEGGRAEPWAVSDAPEAYIASQLKGIVGLEIEITRLVGKFKLGQNKEARDIQGAAQGLKASGKPAVGEAMLSATGHPLHGPALPAKLPDGRAATRPRRSPIWR